MGPALPSFDLHPRSSSSSRLFRRWLTLFVVSSLSVVGLTFAPPASAAITSFSSTIVPGTVTTSTAPVRLTYQWTAPAPAAAPQVTFTSTTNATVWVFELSTDTMTTASGTVLTDARSMVGSSGCTMCIVSKVSGPGTYLPNDLYTVQMSFLDSLGETSSSNMSSLTPTTFSMPPTSLSPASSASAGANGLTLSATTQQNPSSSTSPTNQRPRFVIAGTGSCSTKLTTVTLQSNMTTAPPAITLDYANPPTVTTTATTPPTVTGDALVRGCRYDISYLWRNSLLYPPLPSNTAFAPFASKTSTSVLIPTAPGTPTIETVTAGNGQASVPFTAPTSDGGNSITGYTVTTSPGDATTTGTTSPITVTGLTNGTEYRFTVTATNGVGPGAASSASNAVTPKAPQTITFNNPGAQSFGTTPTLTATSDSQLSVVFTSATTGVCTTTSGGQLSFLDVGLCTINADQSGSSSVEAANQVQQTFTVSAVAPGAPTIGTAAAGNAQVTVAFTPPTDSGGSPVTGYIVTSSPGDATTTGTSSPITVTGLTNGTQYTFTVAATNAVGTGAASSPSDTVTPKAPASGGGGSSVSSSGSSSSSVARTPSSPTMATHTQQISPATPTAQPPTKTGRSGPSASLQFALGSRTLSPHLQAALLRELAAVPQDSPVTARVSASVARRPTAADRKLARERIRSVRAFLRDQGFTGPIKVQAVPGGTARAVSVAFILG